MVLGGFPDWSGSDWSVLTGNVGGRLNQARCIGIPANMTLCRGIGYAQMRLPNLLDHESVHEATQQAARCVHHSSHMHGNGLLPVKSSLTKFLPRLKQH